MSREKITIIRNYRLVFNKLKWKSLEYYLIYAHAKASGKDHNLNAKTAHLTQKQKLFLSSNQGTFQQKSDDNRKLNFFLQQHYISKTHNINYYR